MTNNRFLLVMSYVFGIGLIILLLMYVWRKVKDVPLGLPIGLAVVLLLLAIIGATIGGIGVGIVYGIRWLYHRFQAHPLYTSLATIGAILVVSCLGLFLFRTLDIALPAKAVDIRGVKYYEDSGLIFHIDYFQYQALPTTITKPETVYRISVDNGIVKYEDKVIWSKLELDIGKPKMVKHRISRDEYIALKQAPYVSSTIHAVKLERNAAFLMLPLVYGLISGLVVLHYSQKPHIIDVDYEVRLG